MIVTEAVSGPSTQSEALAGGNKDCSVGPGVGCRLTAVHCARADGVATERACPDGVAVGSVWTVADGVGCAVAAGGVSSTSVTAAPWQAANSQLSGMMKARNLLGIKQSSPNFDLFMVSSQQLGGWGFVGAGGARSNKPPPLPIEKLLFM